MRFVDHVIIFVSSGHGGAGCVSFRREKYVPRGGPDGGDGGRGGHVIIRTDPQLNTLLDCRYQKQYIAENGRPGMGRKMFGRDGEDKIISVPVGTIVKNTATGEIIADMDSADSEIVIAKGGIGGQGNANFATAARQTPRFAQPGMPGEEMELDLELKLMADVGLLGLPNAGKSTLISVVSNARPKIADYPFTTLVPNLGVVKYGEMMSFVIADIPGIIEGAHKGTGLGLQFLRHVERTRILLHMVDISDMAQGDPVDNLEMLNRELALFSPDLASKPMAVAATKTDAKGDGAKLDLLADYCKTKGLDFFAISAATRDGIDELLRYLSHKVMR